MRLHKNKTTEGHVTEEEEDEEDDDDDEEVDEESSCSITSFEEAIVPQISISTPNLVPNIQLNAKHIKTKKKQKNRDFSRLVLAQTIATCSSTETNHRSMSSDSMAEPSPNHPYGAIWALRFSKDGRNLASAGQSCVIHLWKLYDQVDENLECSTIKVLDEAHHMEYAGHKADILELAWSKNNFLLSGSMDHTVRLWHSTQKDCLCVFQHPNVVTSVEFHPKDDRFFVSGCMDSRIRIWSIPEKRVAFWNEVPGNKCITAVAFTLDGKTVIAGTSDGHCYFYDTQSLKYITQISIASKKGPKITGIEIMPAMSSGEEKILVTSNDSKVRLYNMKDKSLMLKYKGAENNSLQIKATFSDDGRYIISGSENCHAYIWRTEQSEGSSPLHQLQDARNKAISALGHVDEATLSFRGFESHSPTHQQKNGISKWLKRKENTTNDKTRSQPEFFEAHDYIVTTAIFAPTKTRQYIAKSKQDIIYNQLSLRRLSTTSSSSQTSNTEENAEGHILVTADFRGLIKVWRIDPSYSTDTQPLDNTSPSSTRSAVTTPSPRRRNLGLFTHSRYPKQ
ncbi:WD40-repeat-containing domain protein [Gilbertella persicaria]|uniref:WD40-repeat-containing domain protein n=1 Tax=Gilbertella persicaria TaxID=101096 RepID=UPI002220F040|nr:WD40-repeat-containing domain protein [Gilbertella persicaria]KAI8050170.1 WD40-repeat-containing domain protein [Gilbertella persicaria]